MRGLKNQESLAGFLGVNQTTVSRWLNGVIPHRSTALFIAEKFDVPVGDLLDDTKELPFDEFVSTLKASKEKAEAAYPDNKDAAMHAMDYLLEQDLKKREAARLRKVIAELAHIAYDLDPSDDRTHAIYLQMKDGKPPKKP